MAWYMEIFISKSVYVLPKYTSDRQNHAIPDLLFPNRPGWYFSAMVLRQQGRGHDLFVHQHRLGVDLFGVIGTAGGGAAGIRGGARGGNRHAYRRSVGGFDGQQAFGRRAAGVEDRALGN